MPFIDNILKLIILILTFEVFATALLISLSLSFFVI